jgi:hypothetical protein
MSAMEAECPSLSFKEAMMGDSTKKKLAMGRVGKSVVGNHKIGEASGKGGQSQR